MRVAETDVPTPGPDEVLVRVAYCGICGSDLHEYANGPHAIPTTAPHPASGVTAPLVLGHEFCGTVAALGSSVASRRGRRGGHRAELPLQHLPALSGR